MERLNLPMLFMGPSGSGKLMHARHWIESAHKGIISLPLESRTFSIGDGYEARVLASPYHFEIDIPNLSMQDKQIIGDLLTTFFSSGDVLSSLRSSARKLVILRRAHSLSLPAAIRVRAIIQQYVLPPDAAGMLWLTAREMTGPLAILEDAFVHYRVPRMSLEHWNTNKDIPPHLQTAIAWDKCEGRLDRAKALVTFFPSTVPPAWPRRIIDFYDEMISILIQNARSGNIPNLSAILWIRGRVYQSLSFCQTGPEIIDSCASALQRQYTLLEPHIFWKAMSSLTIAEPHTSYRTPLSLEAALLNLFEVVRQNSSVVPLPAKKPTLSNEHASSVEPSTNECSSTTPHSTPATPKTTVKRRAPPRKQPCKP